MLAERDITVAQLGVLNSTRSAVFRGCAILNSQRNRPEVACPSSNREHGHALAALRHSILTTGSNSAPAGWATRVRPFSLTKLPQNVQRA